MWQTRDCDGFILSTRCELGLEDKGISACPPLSLRAATTMGCGVTRTSHHRGAAGSQCAGTGWETTPMTDRKVHYKTTSPREFL